MSGVKELEVLQKSLEINLGVAQVGELRFWFQDAWGNSRVFYGCLFKRGIIVVRLKCMCNRGVLHIQGRQMSPVIT